MTLSTKAAKAATALSFISALSAPVAFADAVQPTTQDNAPTGHFVEVFMREAAVAERMLTDKNYIEGQPISAEEVNTKAQSLFSEWNEALKEGECGVTLVSHPTVTTRTDYDPTPVKGHRVLQMLICSRGEKVFSARGVSDAFTTTAPPEPKAFEKIETHVKKDPTKDAYGRDLI